MVRDMKALFRSIRRDLASNLNTIESGVHFHPGPAGPYVCENPRCVSPGLDLD
jgi:hypothetical protein